MAVDAQRDEGAIEPVVGRIGLNGGPAAVPLGQREAGPAGLSMGKPPVFGAVARMVAPFAWTERAFARCDCDALKTWRHYPRGELAVHEPAAAGLSDVQAVKRFTATVRASGKLRRVQLDQ